MFSKEIATNTFGKNSIIYTFGKKNLHLSSLEKNLTTYALVIIIIIIIWCANTPGLRVAQPVWYRGLHLILVIFLLLMVTAV